MANIKSLLGTRKYLKGRITQIENSLGDIESVSDLSELEFAIKSLDDALAKFELVYDLNPFKFS
jgi:hypothetical protein